ncbi:MAG: hypothetical protein QOH87_1336 [Trebonia sp.]|nr:hypothetical protein [Trebonia sp.]
MGGRRPGTQAAHSPGLSVIKSAAPGDEPVKHRELPERSVRCLAGLAYCPA